MTPDDLWAAAAVRRLIARLLKLLRDGTVLPPDVQ